MFPDVDCVINNAGVQRPINFANDGPLDVTAGDLEIDTNLRRRVCSCAMPCADGRHRGSTMQMSITGLSDARRRVSASLHATRCAALCHENHLPLSKVPHHAQTLDSLSAA